MAGGDCKKAKKDQGSAKTENLKVIIFLHQQKKTSECNV